jgi:hypothetical protein
MSQCTLYWWSSICTCVSTKSFIGLCSPPRIVAWKRKLLLVKYIYKKTTNKKIDVIKKESYNPLRMRNEWNGVDGVCDNRTVNMMVLVLHIRVWSSQEMFGRHMVDIFCPHIFWDVRRYEIILNRYVLPSWKLSFFLHFFCFLLCLVQKTHATYMLQMNYLLVNEK